LILWQLLLLQTLTKVFPATGDQTFTLNNFIVESQLPILILLPAYTGPAPFTIFATVALVLTPVLSGLAIFVTTPPSKSTKVYVVEDSNLEGAGQ
jgi:hypothetical protein